MDSSDNFGEKFNIEKAIKGKVTSKLPEILNKLEDEDLYLIAENYRIRGFYNMEWEKVIEKLLKIIPSPKKLSEKLVLAKPKEYALFLKLLGKNYIKTSSTYYGQYGYLKENGIIFSFYNNNEFYLLIPEEVKEGYDKIDKAKFKKEHDRTQLVLKYIKASCNLYGIIHPEKLIEIFNSQNRGKLGKLELTLILKRLIGREQPFTFHKGFIVDDYFEYDDFEDFEPLLERSSNKPYYIPEKDKFLKYFNDSYFEMTPQLLALRDYVLENMCQDEQMVEYLIDDIDLCCSMEASLDDIIFEFERRGIYFDDTDELREVFQLLVGVYNNSRIWTNRGHTPHELYDGKKESQIDLSAQTLNVTFKHRKKKNSVGRNDLCPCGSGKKYKKCCGK